MVINMKRGEQGFTLIEVMVSVVLMSIGLLGVLQMQIVALQKTTIAYQLTTASGLAESALEDVMSWSNNDPRLLSTSAINSFTLGNSPFTISNVQYTVTCTMNQNTPLSGITQLVVNVQGGGRNISITGYREVI
jgi:type IV pilus assembly protein PilV